MKGILGLSEINSGRPLFTTEIASSLTFVSCVTNDKYVDTYILPVYYYDMATLLVCE